MLQAVFCLIFFFSTWQILGILTADFEALGCLKLGACSLAVALDIFIKKEDYK